MSAVARRSFERCRPARSAFAALLLSFVVLCTRTAAAAGVTRARIFPTSVEVTPGQFSAGAASSDERTRKLALEIDETVAEGVQDLRLLPVRAAGVPASERTLTTLDPSAWVFAPRVSLESDGVHLRLVAVAPNSRVELVREETFSTATLGALDVRTVVMLKDLYDTGSSGSGKPKHPASAPAVSEPSSAPPSTGRPVLALNGAVLGGYFGFAIERASGSSDSRLVYPLVALGTGLGLGTSFLIADEWNITSGHAWYLSAGAWWPLSSVVLLSQAYGGKADYVYLFGMAGAAGGIALGAAAIATSPINEGSAVLAHSGGAFGALLGAMTDAAVQGTTSGSLKKGLGWGMGAGVLLGGAVATQVNISPSRALLLDLSASLGWLAGAALASPLLLVDETDPLRTRLWLASAGAGTIAGGILGWYATKPAPNAPAPKPSSVSVLPYGSMTPGKYGNTVTLGVFGAF